MMGQSEEQSVRYFQMYGQLVKYIKDPNGQVKDVQVYDFKKDAFVTNFKYFGWERDPSKEVDWLDQTTFEKRLEDGRKQFLEIHNSGSE